MAVRRIDETISVAPQIAPEEVPGLAQAGFKGIVNNRPEGEEHGQPHQLVTHRTDLHTRAGSDLRGSGNEPSSHHLSSGIVADGLVALDHEVPVQPVRRLQVSDATASAG